MDKRLFLLNCFRRTISIQPSIWFFRKYQPWIALNILLKLWLIWDSRSYCAILIKGSLLQTLSKWKNKVVETQKKSVYFKKKYHPCNRIATQRTQGKKKLPLQLHHAKLITVSGATGLLVTIAIWRVPSNFYRKCSEFFISIITLSAWLNISDCKCKRLTGWWNVP